MTVCYAIHNKLKLSFVYDGYPRVVEPHTYGIDTRGHPALRAYQVAGGSESGEYVGWKLFHAHEMRGLQVLEEGFSGPRGGYKRGDKAFSHIQCQL